MGYEDDRRQRLAVEQRFEENRAQLRSLDDALQTRVEERDRQAEALESRKFLRKLCTNCQTPDSANFGSLCYNCHMMTSSDSAPQESLLQIDDEPKASDDDGWLGNPDSDQNAVSTRYYEIMDDLLSSDDQRFEDHHIFSQQKELKAYFESAPSDDPLKGFLNIHDYTMTLPVEWHREIHKTWNAEWKDFKAEHPSPTREQLEDHAAKMMEDYHLLEAYLHAFHKDE